MMIGMMLPSAAPTLLIYGMVARRGDGASDAPLRVHIFAGGYLVAWTVFSAVAALAQRAFTAADLLSPMMEARAPLVSGVMLMSAGVYQLTPFKRACLQACRRRGVVCSTGGPGARAPSASDCGTAGTAWAAAGH
jgi:predicted metal-binding membrane protein